MRVWDQALRRRPTASLIPARLGTLAVRHVGSAPRALERSSPMHNLDELNKAIALLYETALFEDRWPAVLEQLTIAFDCFGVGHFIAEGPYLQLRDFHGFGHDPRSVQLYREHYHALDPGLQLICDSSPGEWLPEHMLLPQSLASCREYLHDYAIPNGIGGTAGGRVPLDSLQKTLVFTVQRRPTSEPFGQFGLQMFSHLMPHLSAVAHMTDRIRNLTAQQQLAQAMLDSLQAGMVIVDSSQYVHLANRAARAMFVSKGGIRLRHGRLKCETSSCDARFRSLVASACSNLSAGGGMLIDRQPPAGPLQVSVLPVPAEHQFASLAGARLAIIAIADPELPVATNGLLRSLFGLTAAESELLLALVSGITPKEFGERRHVRISTVRTHLRSVMDKCGCNTQAKLVALARALPSLH